MLLSHYVIQIILNASIVQPPILRTNVVEMWLKNT